MIHGQMGEESLDLLATHVLWGPLVVEQDVAPGPTDVGFFGVDRIVLEPDGVTKLVE